MTSAVYDVVSFDLDGTLVDTAAEIAEAVNRALQDHGIPRRPPEEISLLIGAGARQLMLRLLDRVMSEDKGLAGIVAIDAVLASFEHHYAATAGTSAAPYPGCSDALVALKAAGVRLACVTNKEARYARLVLEQTGLAGHFELLIGGDTLPERKPHASVLRHVAKVLGTDTARMAHVGDSHIDVEAARNAGVAVWAVPYGYNAGVPISEANPEHIFDNLGEVAAHVLAQRHAASSD